MLATKITLLVELIDELVTEADEDWMMKRDKVLAACISNGERVNLEEFASWFVEEQNP